MTLSEEDCNIFILRKLVHVLLVIKTFENTTGTNKTSMLKQIHMITVTTLITWKCLLID